MPKGLKIFLKVILSIVIIVVLVVGGYFAYVFLSYSRIEDNLELTPGGTAAGTTVAKDTTYTIVTQNLGFGAYSQDFTFFMDGGKESWGRSKEEVTENINAGATTVKSYLPDFVLFQEVDFDSTRSYHIDESKELLLGEKIDTTNFWETRRRLILDKADIYTRISDLLIASESNKATLAIFKPVDVKFTYEKDKSDGEEDGVSERNQLAQWDLFEPNDWRIHFRGVDKLPFNFYYEVTDEDGKKFKHKIF